MQSEWDERGLPAGRAEDADGSRGWREPPPAARRGPEPERPERTDRPDRADPARPRWSDQREPSRPPAQGQRRPRTIILNPTGGGTNGAGPDGMAGESLGAGGDDDEQGVTGERPAFPLPATTPGNGIDLRADPFAALDREMARALAKKLAEALKRYATPALVPLVVEQMAEILEVDKPRITRTGKDITPP